MYLPVDLNPDRSGTFGNFKIRFGCPLNFRSFWEAKKEPTQKQATQNRVHIHHGSVALALGLVRTATDYLATGIIAQKSSMLRQALDAAEGQKQQEATAAAAVASETTSLGLGSLPEGTRGYGAAETEEGDSLVQSYDDGVTEDDSLDDEWHDEEESVPKLSIFQKLWQGIKSAFLIVANVENLWDTPPEPRHYQGTHKHSRRANGVVGFWFIVLATSYAGERATFKVLIDRAGPFRLFAVEMVTASHAIMLGIVMIISYTTNQIQIQSLGIPVVDVGLMALLDTASLLLVFLTGYHVPPTLTVILVQFTLPLVAFLTQFVHPDGHFSCRRQAARSMDDETTRSQESPEQVPLHSTDQSQSSDNFERTSERAGSITTAAAFEGTPLPGYGGLSAEHVWGSLIIFLAVLLALLPALYTMANPTFFVYADTYPTVTAYNTLLFVSSCIPAAASQIYKETIFLQYKQPVNIGYLNLLLSIFQFTFASIMAPLVFGLQGLSYKEHWTSLYPSTDFSQNFKDGLSCFFGRLDKDDQLHKYPDDANCTCSLALVCAHSFSIIAVGVAVDKIVSAGATKLMYRGISAGITLAVVSMHVYDLNIPYFNYGPVVDGLNLACLLLLILGSEVYHRVSLQGSTFETVYAEVQNFYDDD
jgi:hypothetical protein